MGTMAASPESLPPPAAGEPRFHPLVAQWFAGAFDGPSECQRLAWPRIQAGENVLIAAPTGSGKTLAAFLAAIDALVREALAGTLPDEIRVVYVSPLKALSNDIQRNLEVPLQGVSTLAEEAGHEPLGIRSFVRTGDTPQALRTMMRKRPPHILVTTPESLYILLTSDSGRAALASTRSVIVDEIHAVAGSKRGAHLALSLERLDAVAARRPNRIGLSATQKPIETVASYLCGAGDAGPRECAVIDAGHVRGRDLGLELPASPLEAVMSAEVWAEIYDRLAELVEAHRSTLIFVNTRRLAERLAHHLSDRLGEDGVTSHHGSLAREQRLDAETRLKEGRLRALVATASLELGIDIGDVDLVCQIASPRSIATLLQRVGRSGHGPDRRPRGLLFPTTRDELVEAVALLDAVARGELDRLHIPERPLDVLAQQLVACVACEEWREDALFALCRRAWPYHELERPVFDAVVRMLAEGYSTRRGRQSAYLHRDAVNGRLRPRAGARLTAITCGGAIPETADYEVREEPEGRFVGTLDEDFAIESMAGDIFQLGNTSWRVLRVEAGTVRVADARGQPPSIPFWFGEAPARSDELSFAVSRLREHLSARLQAGRSEAQAWLLSLPGVDAAIAAQLLDYLGAAQAVFGVLPTQDRLVMERFFDESGGMQLIIHSPHGARLNRAWGLALRKRFCRTFNFELQAAATEEALILSLGETHSFELAAVWRYLHPDSVRSVLVQALLDAPMFASRWRWNATCALAIQRFRGGRKVAPRLQRMNADDLVSVVFPDQQACQENLRGEREIPDHPLVQQTIADCLVEAMDIRALERLVARLQAGAIETLAFDLTEPSPLAQEILTARPYAFLDDAPLEERRTQAVLSRRWLDPAQAADLGRLDAAAIERVRSEAWPEVGSADELHDALCLLGVAVPGHDPLARWQSAFEALVAEGRASTVHTAGGRRYWAATERLPMLRAALAVAECTPAVRVPAEYAAAEWTAEAAQRELLRGRLQALGPVTAARIAESLDLPAAALAQALGGLEQEGFALRGRFLEGEAGEQWCERRLLARIHRYTVDRLRREIEPVPAAVFLRFLLDWQHAAPGARLEGPQAVAAVLEQLQGFDVPAQAWENDLLPARIRDYQPAWLDELCLAGRMLWLRRPGAGGEGARAPVRSTPICFVPRRRLDVWRSDAAAPPVPGAAAQRVWTALERDGPQFFEQLADSTALLASQLEDALAELVSAGLVRSDAFRGLRAYLRPREGRRGRQARSADLTGAGRWERLAPPAAGTAAPAAAEPERLEYLARGLLGRYGVLCRRLLERERALPPWRELLGALRRLEARGEIRGGRFVDGMSGEQFAHPDAVAALRAVRRRDAGGELISLSAADPLNLVGILTPGPRIPALAGNRVLYRDGLPVAAQLGREVRLLVTVEQREEWALRSALLRRAGTGGRGRAARGA